MSQYIIPAAAAIIVAIIEALALRDRANVKRANARTEERAKICAEESRLSMQLSYANLELGLATALAVEQHKLNGEMRRAKESAEKAQEEYQKFLQKVTATAVTK